jgi:hypothetical protein
VFSVDVYAFSEAPENIDIYSWKWTFSGVYVL